MDKCCCTCGGCKTKDECYPKDEDSLRKWRKDFDNLRQQWSDFNLCGPSLKKKGCQCCCCNQECPSLVKGRFGLAWVTETPKRKCCTPCGWQLEICDTPSVVECRCKKMEEWAKCPPINECCCRPKPLQRLNRRKCITKPFCCGVKVTPCSCTQQMCDCHCEGSTNDKASETENIENKEKKEQSSSENFLYSQDLTKPDTSTPNQTTNRSRGRRRRR